MMMNSLLKSHKVCTTEHFSINVQTGISTDRMVSRFCRWSRHGRYMTTTITAVYRETCFPAAGMPAINLWRPGTTLPRVPFTLTTGCY